MLIGRTLGRCRILVSHIFGVGLVSVFRMTLAHNVQTTWSACDLPRATGSLSFLGGRGAVSTQPRCPLDTQEWMDWECGRRISL